MDIEAEKLFADPITEMQVNRKVLLSDKGLHKTIKRFYNSLIFFRTVVEKLFLLTMTIALQSKIEFPGRLTPQILFE
jgi:hypothetical protein